MQRPEIFINHGKAYDESLVTPVHETGHALEFLLAGYVPDWVHCIPGEGINGSVSGARYLIADMGQDYDRPWKHQIKMDLGGLVAAAKYCGAYLYERAGKDLERVEETAQLYRLTDGEVLECYLETHRDISTHWDLILEMAQVLREKKILGAEYYEEILLTR